VTRASSPRWIERAGTAVALIVLLGGLCALWLTGVSGRAHLAANIIGSYFVVWGLLLLVVKGSRAEMTMRFGLTSVALSVVFLCAEATAVIGGIDYRVVFGVPIQRALWQRPHRAFDPELGWVYKPYARFSGVTQGGVAKLLCLSNPPYPYSVRLDRHGFRNAEDLDTADVAVIGDSFIEAAETPSDRIMTSVLSRLTKSTVANLGRGGYSPQQELIVLQRYALPLRPKVVVWTFYEGNDLLDLEYHDAMMSALARGELRVSPSAYERSFILGALGGLYALIEGCTPERGNWFSLGTFRTAEGQDVPIHFFMYTKLRNDSWSPQHAAALRRVRNVLQQAYEVMQGQGITLVVAFIPLSFRVYKDIVQCTDSLTDNSTCATWTINDLPQRFETAVAEVSDRIPYIDLTPLFVAEARKGRLSYIPDDTHWSAEGHRVAAEAIAKSIKPFLRRRQP
jgi:hypothetical protein